MTNEKKLDTNSIIVAMAALRFLYKITLNVAFQGEACAFRDPDWLPTAKRLPAWRDRLLAGEFPRKLQMLQARSERRCVSEIPLRLCLIQTQFTAADVGRVVLLLKDRDDLIESEDQPEVETSFQ